MTLLLIGLIAFLGLHSLRLVAPGWREARIRAWGQGAWKAAYSVLAIATFVLLLWGYGEARLDDPRLLWQPPVWARHLAATLTLPAFVLVVAAYVPGNHFKAWVGHPMLAGIKLWALAHLLANGWLHAMTAFAAFLAWAIVLFVHSRRRDRAQGVQRSPGRWLPTLATVAVGAAAWALFAFHLHARWIGVAPLG
jgi:uncharacterized membrane protein